MKWFKLKKPNPDQEFVGKVITAYPTAKDVHERTNGARIKVEHIAGNLRHQTMFQINGSHLVSMLDAYSELNKADLPNLETHQDFLSTVCEHIALENADKTEKPKLSLIDRNPTHG